MNTRYRVQKRLFREPVLVLQVEVKMEYYSNTDIDDPRNGEQYTKWRDARVEDLTTGLKVLETKQ